MHYIHKVGCTSVRQVPVTGTCSFRLITQIRKDSCLSETQIHRSSNLWVSHGYTCVDPQVTQTRAQPYIHQRHSIIYHCNRFTADSKKYFELELEFRRWKDSSMYIKYCYLHEGH